VRPLREHGLNCGANLFFGGVLDEDDVIETTAPKNGFID
jgi:hypothetical protein